MRRTAATFVLAIVSLSLAAGPALAQRAAQDATPYDLLITGGQVLDGTGNPWFYADVAVKDGKIVAVGNLAGARAARTLDARGKAVVPGFIDIHSHADDGSSPRGGLRDADARRRAAPNLVAQGITTVVVNQDGRSPWPIREQLESYRKNGIGPNAALMIGHGTVRRLAMGTDFRRPARPDEVANMRELVRQGMAEGAYGVSAGLEYVPGRWSTTDEVVEVVQEIVAHGGVYISHERSEGSDPMWYWPSQDPAGPPNLLDAVRETIEIGERTGATVVASHLKAKGVNYWGSSRAAIGLIERARARGVRVYGDQYPYDTSGSDGGTVLIPDWALAPRQAAADDDAPARGTRPDHAAALRKVLAEPAASARVRLDIRHEIARRGGPEKIMVFEHPNRDWVEKTLAQISALRGASPVETAIALQLEGDPQRRGGGRVRGFSLSEEDVEAYAGQTWMATATDGGIALPEDGPAVHARYYGTFPRKLRHYALERGALSFEDAIRSATSLPAQILGLRDRGLVREGFHADLVVLDPARVRDRATFLDPHQFPEGIDYVLVGGAFVVEAGKPTGALPGKVIAPARRSAAATDDGR